MFDETAFQEAIATGSEAKLYFLINELGGYLFYARHYMGRRPGLEPTDETFRAMAKAREQIELAVAQTVRFGVTQPFADAETKVASAEYWIWFLRWDAWQNGLSPEEWDRIDTIFNEGHDAEIVLPPVVTTEVVA